MEMYKQAIFEKLRVPTIKGLLSVEQLPELSIDELDNLAVSLEIAHRESGKKTFLVKTSVKDKIAKLRFDIVLDILNTKVEEAQALAEAAEIKEHNKKIIALISEKKDESLKGKSIKQLEALLK